MAIEVNGTTVATTDAGYLEDLNDWNEDVCKVLAEEEGIELDPRKTSTDFSGSPGNHP